MGSNSLGDKTLDAWVRLDLPWWTAQAISWSPGLKKKWAGHPPLCFPASDAPASHSGCHAAPVSFNWEPNTPSSLKMLGMGISVTATGKATNGDGIAKQQVLIQGRARAETRREANSHTTY